MSIRTLRKEQVKKKGLNIKFPLRKGAAGAFDLNETTLDAVRDDLRMLLLTNHGERLVHGLFGANLRALLFENMSQDFETRIQDAIVLSVERWIPFVSVKDIEVKTGQNDLSLGPNETNIKVFFSVNNTDLEDVLEVKFSI